MIISMRMVIIPIPLKAIMMVYNNSSHISASTPTITIIMIIVLLATV